MVGEDAFCCLGCESVYRLLTREGVSATEVDTEDGLELQLDFSTQSEVKLGGFGWSLQRADGSLSVVSANLLQTNRHAGEVAEALTGTGADVIAVLELSLSMRGELERRLGGWPHRAFSPREGGEATCAAA